jgi:DNA polymerase-4
MTLPQDVWDRKDIRMYLLKLSEMVCARARRHGLMGRTVSLTLRYPDFYTFTRQRRMSRPTNDTHTLYRASKRLISSIRLRAPLRLIGVSLSGIVDGARQLPLFTEELRREKLLGAMDEINTRFGHSALTWSALLEPERTPGVISPAWRPEGVRNIDVG